MNRASLSPQETYSVEQVCEILGVGQDTICDAIRRNQLPIIRVGGRIFIPKSALKDGPPEWARDAWNAATVEQARRPRRSHER